MLVLGLIPTNWVFHMMCLRVGLGWDKFTSLKFTLLTLRVNLKVYNIILDLYEKLLTNFHLIIRRDNNRCLISVYELKTFKYQNILQT